MPPVMPFYPTTTAPNSHLGAVNKVLILPDGLLQQLLERTESSTLQSDWRRAAGWASTSRGAP